MINLKMHRLTNYRKVGGNFGEAAAKETAQKSGFLDSGLGSEVYGPDAFFGKFDNQSSISIVRKDTISDRRGSTLSAGSSTLRSKLANRIQEKMRRGTIGR